MTDKEWRPKVGERVLVQGTFANEEWGGGKMRVEFSDRRDLWFFPSELSPLPAPAAPRAAWEVLRDGVTIMLERGYHRNGNTVLDMLKEAVAMEAAAAMKPPPTLAEAATHALHLLKASGQGDTYEACALREALARAEAGQ